MSETYKPHNRSLEPLEPLEMLPSFLDAVRSVFTGQVTAMDRHDRENHTKFCAGIVECYKPVNALETQLAYSIAADYWRLNRTRGLEEGIFAICHPNPTGDFGDITIAHQIANSQTNAFLGKQADFKFLSQYEMRIQRMLNRNKAELKELQASRPKPKLTPAEWSGLIPTQPEPQTGAEGHGFVFSNQPIALESPATEPTLMEPGKTRTATAQASTAEPAVAERSGLIPTNPESQKNVDGNGFVFSTHAADPGTPLSRHPAESPLTAL